MLWGLTPIEPQAAYGVAVDRLRRQIHAGLLLPDERLPAERQLSDRFGISRMTLREALRVLESDSYITVRRGAQGGAFVTDADRLAQLARRRMARAPATAMRVMEFLETNLSAAVRFAGVRRGPAELKRLREARALRATAATGPLRKQAEALFLLALGDATQNPLMARAIEDGLAELFLPFETTPPLPQDPGGDAFAALLAALEAEDAGAAEAAMLQIHADLWASVRRFSRHAA